MRRIDYNNIGKNKDINILTVSQEGTTIINAIINLANSASLVYSPAWSTGQEVARDVETRTNDIPYSILQAITVKTFQTHFEGSQANYDALITALLSYANDPKWDMSDQIMFPKSTTLSGGAAYVNPYFTIIWFYSNCLNAYKVCRRFCTTLQKETIETFLYKAADWCRDYTEYHIGRILVSNYLNWIDTDIENYTFSGTFDTVSLTARRWDNDPLFESILQGNANTDNRPVHGAEFLNDFVLYVESVDWRIRVNSYRDSQFSFFENLRRMRKVATQFVKCYLAFNIPDDAYPIELLRCRDGASRGYGYCLTTLGYCCKIAWDLWKQNNDDSLFRYSTQLGRGASVKTTPKNLLDVCKALATLQFGEELRYYDTVLINGKNPADGLWAANGQGIFYLYDYYRQQWIKNFCQKNARNNTNLLANGWLTGSGSIGNSRKEIWCCQEGITPYLLIF